VGGPHSYSKHSGKHEFPKVLQGTVLQVLQPVASHSDIVSEFTGPKELKNDTFITR